MVLSLLLWPAFAVTALFFFDAPIRTKVDEICRWGMVLTIWLSGYDYVESQSFAFDKNRYYQGNPNPRLEKLRQDKYRKDSK